MNARYSAPLSALPWTPLTLPRTSLLRAFATVARRLVQHATKAAAYGYLSVALRLTMRRYNDAVAERLYATYIDHDPRRTCLAVERQRAMRKRYAALLVERNWVRGWEIQ